MLRPDLCNYSDAYIVVKGRITVEGDNDDKKRNKKLIFKNNAPFRYLDILILQKILILFFQCIIC